MAEFDAEFDSDSENIHPYLPYYYLHMITDAEAESIMASELPGSWILREHPYVITIRIGDGYVHHTDIHIQFRPYRHGFRESYMYISNVSVLSFETGAHIWLGSETSNRSKNDLVEP
jgi:hypothetical protein